MADKFNICEEIEIAILSDSELTQEQKDHIDNCESCKALLSQVSSMKSDLHDFSVPGIKEGQIADSVMASIKKQKTSVPFPKFKLTHHLGTAAAVAIILVAALIIKNPSDTGNSDLSISGNSATISETEEATVENHVLSANLNRVGGTDDVAYSTYYDAVPAPESAPSAQESESSNEISRNRTEISFKYNNPTNDAYIGEQVTYFNDEEHAESVTEDIADIIADEDYAEEYEASSENIFFDIEFGTSLEENIKLANERIFEITGEQDVFDISDFDSNEEFLSAIETFEI